MWSFHGVAVNITAVGCGGDAFCVHFWLQPEVDSIPDERQTPKVTLYSFHPLESWHTPMVSPFFVVLIHPMNVGVTAVLWTSLSATEQLRVYLWREQRWARRWPSVMGCGHSPSRRGLQPMCALLGREDACLDGWTGRAWNESGFLVLPCLCTPIHLRRDRACRVKSETSFDGNRRSVLCATHTSTATMLSRTVTILVSVPSYGYSPQTRFFLISIPHAEERPSFLIDKLFFILFLSRSLLLTTPISFVHNVCEMRRRGRRRMWVEKYWCFK